MVSTIDYKNGILNIVVIEPKEKNKVTNISIDLNVVHPLDKMDPHRQTRELLNIDMMIATLGIKNLQNHK